MQTAPFKSSYMSEFLAWLMFLCGVANATLIWFGLIDIVPEAFLLPSGGHLGTGGVVLLGLLTMATWCAVGMLLATLPNLLSPLMFLAREAVQ